MNLASKLTGTERLTLYYDSVEELGQLPSFKCLFFASSRSDFRIEYVAFTLLTRGNLESDKSLKRFRIALKRKMTKKDNKALRSVLFVISLLRSILLSYLVPE